TARCAEPNCITSEGKLGRVPASERSVKPLPATSPPTEKQPKKRPKPPKADRDLWVFERQAFGLGYATVAGVDEAGRGPWAGPVVAGASIMRPYFHCEGIDDSKLLSPHWPIVKGDRRSSSIMCGGILAKVTRDRLMMRMAEKFPGYGFEAHKGYPTPDHLAAMDRHGLSPLHRRSFISIRTRAELEA